MTFVILTSIISVLLVILTAFNLLAAHDNRKYSCEATGIALESIADLAKAGLRPVPKELPSETPPYLRAAFERELALTRASNARRLKVATSVEKAHIKLSASSYCP